MPAAAVPAQHSNTKRLTASSQKQTAVKKCTPKKIKIVKSLQKTSASKRKTVTASKKLPKATQVANIAVKTKTASRRSTPKAIIANLNQDMPQDSSNLLPRQITAKSAYIMDAANGQTIFAVSPDTPRQPASTIKILTGLIAIKSLKLGESVPVSEKAAEQPSSKVNLDQQRQYKAHDLINAVLLSSANDASVALAEKIAGSENSFAQMMTQQARNCGAQQTICKTANGLTAEGQSSTARDLATIFRHAMEDDEFSQRMKQVKAHTAEGKLLRNHNKALWQIKGTEGGKTGFTNAAGQTYVGKFKRGDREIIIAIMGSNTMWADIKTLVEYGFSTQPMVANTPKKTAKTKLIAGIPEVRRQR